MTTTLRLRAKLGSVHIPYFPRLTNYGLNTFTNLAFLIDQLDSRDREWEKVAILANAPSYLTFLAELTHSTKAEITGYLNDFYDDTTFRSHWSPTLYTFETEYSGVAGDVRFNSLSLYVVVRAMLPDIVVETGVAAGKSSTLILLAMSHNKKGKLYSIDLPNPDGKRLPDGSCVTTKGRPVGWLVPDNLRDRWSLSLGDSLRILPQLLASLDAPVDIFFHDSLHTFEHARSELDLIDQHRMSNQGLILVDDIDMACGEAFNAFLAKRRLVGLAFRELGGCSLASHATRCAHNTGDLTP